MKKLFNFNEIEKIPFYKRAVYLRQFGKVRRGSSRLVLELNDKWVIKVAYNEKGVAQNGVEYEIYKYASSYERSFLAKINIRRNLSGDFIFQEKVKPFAKQYKRSLEVEKFSNKKSFLNFCRNYDLYKNEILEQLGKNSRGKLVTYDYGFNKYVAQNYYV